jgi:predicted DNA-binding ArsR family transcriptional regulator
MKVGQTITQDDINLKLFEDLEKLSEKIDKSEERAEERQEKFEKNIREDMKQFTAIIDRQGKWQLAIFTVLTVGILYKLFSIPVIPVTP